MEGAKYDLLNHMTEKENIILRKFISIKESYFIVIRACRKLHAIFSSNFVPSMHVPVITKRADNNNR